MDQFAVTLTLSESTKGTHVYANSDEGMSVYVPKDKIKGNAPAAILVTFEEAK